MFDTDITIFNYDIKNDIYYPKLVFNTEFQPIYKTDPDNYQTNSETSSLIIIMYNIFNGEIYINTDDNKQYYLTPKEWDDNIDKNSYITFHNNTDFIIIGDHTNIKDADLNEIKNNNDDVFIINEIKHYKTPIPLSHFELTVN